MIILKPANWTDYELIDSGNGKRLERFGKFILVRPDPQCLWKPSQPAVNWQKADAVFETEGRDKGKWIKRNNIPSSWQINYSDIKILVKLSPFKHTGVFPEQSIHWDFIREALTKYHAANPNQSKPKVLNLFGYTGIASLTAASAGALVTHVDASYPTIGWARESQKLSGLEKSPIRWILEDCLKFVEREVRRGSTYQGIILDPPVYGHGPKGEKWDFNTLFPKLIALCSKLIEPNAAFLVVNAYAVSASSVMLENVLKDYFKNGTIESGELALEESKSKRLLSTGIYARWAK